MKAGKPAEYTLSTLILEHGRTDNTCCFCQATRKEPMLCLTMEVPGAATVELVLCAECLEGVGFVPEAEAQRLRELIETTFNRMNSGEDGGAQ